MEMGGAIEESQKGTSSIFMLFPIMILAMLTLLMIQLQGFTRLAIVFFTAPLGIVGASVALNLAGKPFGFVALLGLIALAGMDMRNTVILVDQIETDVRERGLTRREAIVFSTMRRARPVALTALAAILAMIPLSESAFWGPMAYTIMGGLSLATFLTLFLTPSIYALWFRNSLGPASEASLRDARAASRSRSGGAARNEARDCGGRNVSRLDARRASIISRFSRWPAILAFELALTAGAIDSAAIVAPLADRRLVRRDGRAGAGGGPCARFPRRQGAARIMPPMGCSGPRWRCSRRSPRSRSCRPCATSSGGAPCARTRRISQMSARSRAVRRVLWSEVALFAGIPLCAAAIARGLRDVSGAQSALFSSFNLPNTDRR